MNTLEHLIAMLLVAVIPITALGVFYIWYLWWVDGRDSAFMSLIAFITPQIWFAGAYLCWIASIRIDYGLEAVPVWTQWVTTAIGFDLMFCVGLKAFYFWRSRRKHPHGTGTVE